MRTEIKEECTESKKTTMSVAEMRRILGLGKTESYWLVHKGFFETIMVNNRMRINIASFEKWYANQVRYQKVVGEPPGMELKDTSYSITDVAEMIETTENVVYDLIKSGKMETIIVDHWKRVPVESFEEWYVSQDHYRLKEERLKEDRLRDKCISMPQMAWLLGVDRNVIYKLLDKKSNQDIFDIVMIAGKRYVTIESFETWYAGQKEYKKSFSSIEKSNADHAKMLSNIHTRTIENVHKINAARYRLEHPEGNKNHRRKSDRGASCSGKAKRNTGKLSGVKVHLSRESKNPNYFSVDEAAESLHVKPTTIRKWIRDKKMQGVKILGSYRIPVEEVERIAEERFGKEDIDGINREEE